MKSAVIKTGGKQYLVKEGQELKVEKLPNVKVGDKINLDQVLLTLDGDKLVLGTPRVAGASVSAEVSAHGRHPKITVVKFKAKTRERNKRGHRQPYTAVIIKKIS